MSDAVMVASVGDNCVDRFLPPIGLSVIGGNAVNVAVQLTRAGWRAAYFGAVGRDAAGDRVIAAITAHGVDAAHLRRRDGHTGFTDIAVDASGDRRFLQEDYGACAGYRPDSADIAALCRMRHVHLGWLAESAGLKTALTSAGVSFSQDFAVNPASGAVPILFASAGDSPDQAENLATTLLAVGAALAVVTMGARGSFASDGKRSARTGSLPGAIVDTTGAGDSFIAGFVGAHLQGLDLQACLERGRDRAAETCRHLGGFPQTPLPILSA